MVTTKATPWHVAGILVGHSFQCRVIVLISIIRNFVPDSKLKGSDAAKQTWRREVGKDMI
jgi:hypothetical protein